MGEGTKSKQEKKGEERKVQSLRKGLSPWGGAQQRSSRSHPSARCIEPPLSLDASHPKRYGADVNIHGLTVSPAGTSLYKLSAKPSSFQHGPNFYADPRRWWILQTHISVREIPAGFGSSRGFLLISLTDSTAMPDTNSMFLTITRVVLFYRFDRHPKGKGCSLVAVADYFNSAAVGTENRLGDCQPHACAT